jgi:hypothetical protein
MTTLLNARNAVVVRLGIRATVVATSASAPRLGEHMADILREIGEG